MKAQKDTTTGTWLIQYRYTDWQGIRKKSTKRGFATKREAEEWLRNFLQARQSDFSMNFESFLALYYQDLEPRIRQTTMRSKQYIIDRKILPYFGKKPVCDITANDIRHWQGELMKKGYAPTYLRTINNQLTAIFNFAVKYHDLKTNPCTKAGRMGKNQADEMQFWTKAEFEQFVDAVMDKHRSYLGFKLLFWTGIRIGELLALTVEDVNLEGKELTVNKSYQRLDGQDIITPPKTPKSNRVIALPDFLAADIADYLTCLYQPKKKDRLFPVTKSYFESEMKRGTKESGVKKVRLHDLRHSHCALLFEMGTPPLEVAERLGHERVETTLNIYAHLYPNKQKHISAKLDAIYEEVL